MTVRIGVIGAGMISEPHVAGYLALGDEARVVAVADVNEQNARGRAAQAGGADMHLDYRELLTRDDVDAVDICLPHHLHAEAIIASAQAGKHVLCEKPLCLSLDEAREIRAAVEMAGITLMCAHNQLFLPTLRRARELLDAGTLGAVYQVRVEDSFVNELSPDSMGWRAHRSAAGGGVLIDTGVHPSYMLLHLAGEEPREVTATLATHRLTFAEGEDTAEVTVRFASGATGRITTSWAFEPPPGAERFSVVGELGSLSGDADRLRWRLRDGTVAEEFLPKDGPLFTPEVAHFVACVREGMTPIQTIDDGERVLRLVLDAYRSAREGRTVEAGAR